MGAGFWEFGRGKVDGDLLFIWEAKTGVADTGADALAAFLDGFVRHADNVKRGQPESAVAFGSYQISSSAGRDCRLYF